MCSCITALISPPISHSLLAQPGSIPVLAVWRSGHVTFLPFLNIYYPFISVIHCLSGLIQTRLTAWLAYYYTVRHTDWQTDWLNVWIHDWLWFWLTVILSNFHTIYWTRRLYSFTGRLSKCINVWLSYCQPSKLPDFMTVWLWTVWLYTV